jgi:Lar family restriction alleviation protein
MSDLKKCPFCGGKAKLYGSVLYKKKGCTDAKYVACSECKAKGPTVEFDARKGECHDAEEATAAWNRRALDGEIDRLTAENAMLLKQRDPRHRSELDDVEIVKAAKDIESTARANMAKMLHIE